MQSIPLDNQSLKSNGLYSLVQSCITSKNQKYAPVLIEIVNEDLLVLENPQNERIKYLLQVWNSDGKKVYERRLKDIPRYWGMFEDIFIYLEQSREVCPSSGLYVIKF